MGNRGGVPTSDLRQKQTYRLVAVSAEKRLVADKILHIRAKNGLGSRAVSNMRCILGACLAVFVICAEQMPAFAIDSASQLRGANKGPSPGTESALRDMLNSFESGKPDMSRMTPTMAAAAKPYLAGITSMVQSLGARQSIVFLAADPQGADIFEVQYALGKLEWRIAPLTKDGKIATIYVHREYKLKHLVDIGGGRHLNLVCSGKGSPTVVFLQGFNGGITDWRDVREPVAAITRICLYDRAGFGYSDPSDRPMTSDNIADDLHALLGAAAIKDQVVLVGHSMGGLYATYFADKFFSDMAGMVLVDPSFDGQFGYPRSEADEKALRLDADQFYSLMNTCTGLAQAGALTPGDPKGCFQMPSFTQNETDYLSHQFLRPSYYTAMRSQFENYTPVGGSTLAGDQEHNLRRSFGNMPLVVMTAGLQPWTLTEDGNKALRAVWKAGHDKLAERSTRGESILLPNAHHFIQADQPNNVIEAIRKVVMEARQ